MPTPKNFCTDKPFTPLPGAYSWRVVLCTSSPANNCNTGGRVNFYESLEATQDAAHNAIRRLLDFYCTSATFFDDYVKRCGLVQVLAVRIWNPQQVLVYEFAPAASLDYFQAACARDPSLPPPGPGGAAGGGSATGVLMAGAFGLGALWWLTRKGLTSRR